MKSYAPRLLFLAFLIQTTSMAAPTVFPGADWAEATPASQGVDAAKLEKAVAYLKEHTGRDGVQELVLVRNGRLIWKGTDIDKQHGVWSLTKSFTSTVLGLLIDDGKATLDTRAKDHLPSLAERFPDVALRHFASMTSGYYAEGDEPRGSYTHGPSTTPFTPGQKPLFTPPGSRYAYWDSAMNQFGNVLTRIAGEPLEDLFQRRIADPIGLDRAKWSWGRFQVDGLTVNGGAGNQGRHILISARELARFGLLFLNQGNWDGTQLISPEWIAEATSVQVPRDLPLGHAESSIDGRGVYGFNWWVNEIQADGRRKWPGAPPGTYAAAGFNNNRCFVIPEWNMVVVRLGLDGNIPDAAWSEFFTLLSAAVQTEPRRDVEREPIFHCDFEADNWHEEWGVSKRDPRNDTVLEDPERKFEPLRGKALRVRVEEGGHLGANLQFRFQRRTGEEPDEIYFRYYIRFADDWNPRRGGKLPGIAGTYGRAGWGGRPVQGDDGWSARGLFQGQANGKTPIGFYCYHMDMRGRYGNNWVWDQDLGQLENNRWYSIEQYAKLNTPGQNDGILRGWVDGKLAFEKTDLRMRNTDTVRIETIWLNVYHGGTWTAENDQHLYIDEVAVSRNYIGPLDESPSPEFFAFDNGVGRGQWTPEEQAATLKALGYDGISYNYTDNAELKKRIQAFKEAGLKIYALYFHTFPDRPEPYDPALKEAIQMLAGSDTVLWMTVRETKTKGDHDQAAAELVRKISELARESGLRVALYPHANFYVATADDAVRIAQLADRDNAGVTLNLCHEFLEGQGERLDQTIQNAAPHLMLVSINGVDTAGKRYILNLDEGDFDQRAFLQKIRAAGYNGPVGLQCYGIGGNQKENLQRSIQTWTRLQEQLGRE